MLLHLPQNSFVSLLSFSGDRLMNLLLSFSLLMDENLVLLFREKLVVIRPKYTR